MRIYKFQFANLPFERGEILFSKGFFYLYGYSQTTRKSRSSYTLITEKVDVFSKWYIYAYKNSQSPKAL